MAAECYCTQVILLLHRVAFTVETNIVDTTTVDHCFITGSDGVEAVISVVRAEVHPIVVAAGSEFVLELDVVEILVVNIKSVNDYRQIPSGGVLRRECIHNPFVVRSRDIHGASHRHEMSREGTSGQFGCATIGGKRQCQVLEVISFTGIHLHAFECDFSAFEAVLTSVLIERCTVNIDFGTLGVRTILHFEGEFKHTVTRTVRYFAFVGHLDIEYCGLINRNVAALMHVDIQFGVLEFERTGREGHSRRIEASRVGSLPRAACSTTVQEIDIRSIAVIAVSIREIVVTFGRLIESVMIVHYAINGYIDMFV